MARSLNNIQNSPEQSALPRSVASDDVWHPQLAVALFCQQARLLLVLSEVDLRLAELRLNLSVRLLQHEDVVDELVLRPVVVLGLTLRFLGYFLCR